MRLPTPTATATPLPDASRVITYTYDGLDRLVGAIESPGTTSAYGYDLAGNRTSVAVHGAAPVITTSNLANKITSGGVSYDLAGNLANDGMAASTFDALNRMTTRGGTTYAYNGDGALISQLTAGVTTRFTQDLVAPLSQVLQTFTGATRTDYLYGMGRLATQTSPVRTWYVADALGSVRRMVSEAGVPQGVITYDPWGTVESGAVPVFGFTGELQQGGAVYLRARWYHAGRGAFGSRDPFAGIMAQPRTLAQYPYAENDPVNRVDPSGNLAFFVAGAGSELDDPGQAHRDIWELARYLISHNIKMGEVILASWSAGEQMEAKIGDVRRTCPNEPIILVGHSLGGASVMAVAYRSPNVPIDLVVTIDPVDRMGAYALSNNKNPWPFVHSSRAYNMKANNVKRHLNILEDLDAIERVHGMEGRVIVQTLVNEYIVKAENVVIPGTSHSDVDGDKRTWDMIESAINEIGRTLGPSHHKLPSNAVI